MLVCYDPSTSTTTATSYLYILFAITFKLVCILILKRTSNHIFGPGSWLCVNAGGEELFDVVMAGRLPPQYYWICRPLSCPKVLCWLLFWLYYQQRKREGGKLRLPLDMSKQTKVCRVWFIQRMSVIQTSLRILMSSVGIIEYWSCLINNLPALCLQDWGSGEI